MKPDCLIIGGPNGAGKSTIYTAIKDCDGADWVLDPIHIPVGNFINPDTIAREANAGDSEAGRLAISKRMSFRDRGESFAFETTLSGRSVAKWAAQLRENDGYRIITAFIWLRSAELSMARVTHRATKGKHYIPMTRILTRHLKSVRNFVNDIAPLSDIWVVVDNSGTTPTICGWGGASFVSGHVMLTEPSSEPAARRFVEFYRTGYDPCITNRYAHDTRCDSPPEIHIGDRITGSILQGMQAQVASDLRSRPEGTTVVYLDEQDKMTFSQVLPSDT